MVHGRRETRHEGLGFRVGSGDVQGFGFKNGMKNPHAVDRFTR